jgi:hypothetical protein
LWIFTVSARREAAAEDRLLSRAEGFAFSKSRLEMDGSCMTHADLSYCKDKENKEFKKETASGT